MVHKTKQISCAGRQAQGSDQLGNIHVRIVTHRPNTTNFPGRQRCNPRTRSHGYRWRHRRTKTPRLTTRDGARRHVSRLGHAPSNRQFLVHPTITRTAPRNRPIPPHIRQPRRRTIHVSILLPSRRAPEPDSESATVPGYRALTLHDSLLFYLGTQTSRPSYL